MRMKSVRDADYGTPLNMKKIDIEVNEGLIKEGGIFSSSYITYKVCTSGPISYEVRRKDADFNFLRKILLKQCPHVIVPPCVQKAPKMTPKYIKKREVYYTRFLQAVARSEELKSSKFLHTFLSEKDLKAFQKAMKEADKAKFNWTAKGGNVSIEELVTGNGEAKV